MSNRTPIRLQNDVIDVVNKESSFPERVENVVEKDSLRDDSDKHHNFRLTDYQIISFAGNFSSIAENYQVDGRSVNITQGECVALLTLGEAVALVSLRAGYDGLWASKNSYYS